MIKAVSIFSALILVLCLYLPNTAKAQDTLAQCREVCIQAGVDDVETCSKVCGEYTSSEFATDASVGCWLKLLADCGLDPREMWSVMKIAFNCIKSGFKGSACANPKQLCEVTETCMSDLCGCAGAGPPDCMAQWKAMCRK